jgi:hypothetical protein
MKREVFDFISFNLIKMAVMKLKVSVPVNKFSTLNPIGDGGRNIKNIRIESFL